MHHSGGISVRQGIPIHIGCKQWITIGILRTVWVSWQFTTKPRQFVYAPTWVSSGFLPLIGQAVPVELRIKGQVVVDFIIGIGVEHGLLILGLQFPPVAKVHVTGVVRAQSTVGVGSSPITCWVHLTCHGATT